MASQRWTRAELEAIVAARARRNVFEGHGPDGYIDLHVQVTPEFLAGMLGGRWVNADGSVAVFDGVWIGDDGYATPILTRVDADARRA